MNRVQPGHFHYPLHSSGSIPMKQTYDALMVNSIFIDYSDVLIIIIIISIGVKLRVVHPWVSYCPPPSLPPSFPRLIPKA